jgi:small conductance mechanosensitive channel
VLKAAPVYLGVQALSSSSVDLRFIAEVAEKDIYNGARILNHDLLLGFRKMGVECSSPQLDVHSC